jgi:hypothetical protein
VIDGFGNVTAGKAGIDPTEPDDPALSGRQIQGWSRPLQAIHELRVIGTVVRVPRPERLQRALLMPFIVLQASSTAFAVA